MVKPFHFARLPEILFGPGKISELPAIIRKFGKTIILVTGRQSFIHSDAGNSLLEQLDKSGMDFRQVIIAGEPSPRMIDEAVSRFRGQTVHAVVAIGGGSTLDAGKAISAMLTCTEPVRDFLEGIGTREHPGTKIPFIGVPTTSGTGSEATKNAVLSETGEHGFKRSLRHENFVPDVALVDPLLTTGCPAAITAASGMDCFTQLTEAYLSTRATPYTDALAMEGLKAIKLSLRQSVVDGTDSKARTGMSFAALTSGICLANAGLGAVHGFASSMGGLCDIPHGVICGTLMAKANELNVRKLIKHPDHNHGLYKYGVLGKLFLEKEGKSEAWYATGFVGFLHELTATLQLPGLKSCGIREEDLRKISSATELKNNPVILSEEDLLEIVTSRFV